jgi:ATP-binding cassette, subfamily B (MDR/TAP), member 10
LWEILDRKYAIPVNGGITPTTSACGEMTFENINFNYPSRMDANVLRDFNLTVEPGKITAVVGRSGSGKSTLAMLLLRLYDPQNGRVLLDGVDLKDLNPTWLRCQIAAVNQEPVLFSGSIRDNILYGLQPDAPVDEDYFQQVVREAHVSQFVDTLPDGVDTLVGQRGMMLSGGQKQRVAIARALIKNPKIMILDEATSALDSESEQLIQQALENITKNRTVLTIAHRLSTIRNADKICVLDEGRVAEQGSYAALMAMPEGIFRELVQRQTFAAVSNDGN